MQCQAEDVSIQGANLQSSDSLSEPSPTDICSQEGDPPAARWNSTVRNCFVVLHYERLSSLIAFLASRSRSSTTLQGASKNIAGHSFHVCGIPNLQFTRKANCDSARRNGRHAVTLENILKPELDQTRSYDCRIDNAQTREVQILARITELSVVEGVKEFSSEIQMCLLR